MGAPGPRANLPLFLSGPVAQKGLSGAPGNSRKMPPLNIALLLFKSFDTFQSRIFLSGLGWGAFPFPLGAALPTAGRASWAQCYPSCVLQQLAVLSHVHSGHSLEGVLEAAMLADLKLWAVSFSHQ